MPDHAAMRALRNPTGLTGAILRFTAGAARPALRTAQRAPAGLSEKAHWLTGSSSGHHTTPIEPKTKGSLKEPNNDPLSFHTGRTPGRRASVRDPLGTPGIRTSAAPRMIHSSSADRAEMVQNASESRSSQAVLQRAGPKCV